jgi:cytoskeletal protein CcmA (bactofilin family)
MVDLADQAVVQNVSAKVMEATATRAVRGKREQRNLREPAMFRNKAQPPIKSLIAEGTRIEGDMTFTEGLRVDGHVKGNTQAMPEQPSILVISEAAVVEGDVRADHVIINGTVRGAVHAGELLELQPKARIEGDVTYRALEMHQGAIISGRLQPLESEEKPLLKLAANNQ